MNCKNKFEGPFGGSELILNENRSIYHLGLIEGQVSDDVIVVGDPERVESISSRCDQVFSKQQSREFAIHQARLGNRDLTILSTGIGVDNIDIVVNELDACANINFDTRTAKKNLRSLNIIRIGTSGSVRKDIPLGSFVASKAAIGMDGVPYHYNSEMTDYEKNLIAIFNEQMSWEEPLPTVYAAAASETLLSSIASDMIHGITFTANGFYGPQGRNLRLSRRKPKLLDNLRNVEYNGHRLTNLEMECAGLYALGGMLGHQMLTCCVILANRYDNSFVDNPQKPISALIDEVLARLT